MSKREKYSKYKEEKPLLKRNSTLIWLFLVLAVCSAIGFTIWNSSSTLTNANSNTETNTNTNTFLINNEERVPDDFMNKESKFNYGELTDLDATALEMNFVNSSYAFVILLPRNVLGLPNLEAKLSNYELAKVSDQMRYQEVSVHIPKFSVQFGTKLKQILENVCMHGRFGFLEIFDKILVSPLSVGNGQDIYKRSRIQ